MDLLPSRLRSLLSDSQFDVSMLRNFRSVKGDELRMCHRMCTNVTDVKLVTRSESASSKQVF